MSLPLHPPLAELPHPSFELDGDQLETIKTDFLAYDADADTKDVIGDLILSLEIARGLA